ncbi:hypothetical protein [Streptomyces sp. GC420]|uniref:hypothetical protein n=1 Tax=Streptomyces sp. GC420 TaxID=2697568 RepID=UPI001414CEA7|nr:hypothetical protein [Streptomyces sp. GC420]NBM15981.1 hypothetical protein [Streptomyces sp. GC420]
MNLPRAVTLCRTLVIEGPDGIGRAPLVTELSRHGFVIRRSPGKLHHVDPTQPYRELLAGPGRIAVDGSLIRELVYGPLLRGRSRVTWIQALDFAETVAERDGAIIHLTAAPRSGGEAAAAGGTAGDTAGKECRAAAGETPEAAAASAYERAFRTLAQHVPVVTVDVTGHSHRIRAPVGSTSTQLSMITR